MPKIELLQCNCLEWLREQPSNCVAAVVSDPPHWLQGLDDLTPFLNDVLAQCLRVARGPVMFVNPIQWEFETERERRIPPRYNPKPDAASMWLMQHGGSRGAAPIYIWRGKNFDPFEIPLPEAAIKGERASVKPVGLFSYLIEQIYGKGTILDPFVGWGTSAKAAKLAGRGFIGIENSPQVFAKLKAELKPQKDEA